MAIDQATGIENRVLTSEESEIVLELFWDDLGYAEKYLAFGWMENARKGKYSNSILYQSYKPDRVIYHSGQIDANERDWISSMLAGGA